MNMTISPEWLERLKLTSRVGKELIVSIEHAATLPCAQMVMDVLEAGASGVFCVDGTPRAAVVSFQSSDDNKQECLEELYTILWNQGELDFLLLLRPDIVEIHTLSIPPDKVKIRTEAGKEFPSLLDALQCVENAGAIADLINGLESGRLLAEHGDKFTKDERVDETLICDLDGVRRSLLIAEGYEVNPALAPQEFVFKIHDVLLQAMFLLYLEDRGIIGSEYIHAHSSNNVDKLHTLLRSNPQAFFQLIQCLDLDCNGGLFTANPLWQKHARILADFLEGILNFKSKQKRLLRLYRFDHIPVELLSEIYDRFLESEDSKEKNGAYYTPRRLASLVVEQVWETLQSHLDAGHMPRVLDPTCGSGVFLATLFQRMATYLGSPPWETLIQLATCLHGLDINPTAVRISAFSLSLALLNRRQPKELQKHMETEGKILPELLGTTLFERSFFDHPLDEQYDCIIGNPPWGNPNQATEGECWLNKQILADTKNHNKQKYPDPPNRERSWPFIWKAIEHLRPHAPIALLLPSQGFFLNNVKESITRLLDFVCITKLVDLSDLRRVLFKKAVFPACILHALRDDGRSSYSFTYICPKADINATRGNRILLTQEDRHQISAWHFANHSIAATQRFMWSSQLERRLLDFLDTLPTLQDLLLETRQVRKQFPENPHPDWGFGLGFQAYNGTSKTKPVQLPELTQIPYIMTKNIAGWVKPENTSWQPYKKAEVLWKNYSEGFTAPHIVMPLSISGKSRFSACYAEHNFSFNKSLMGVTVPSSDEGRATGKFLTAFINSSFAAWYMGTIGLAVNRPRIVPSDILPLPFPQPDDLPNPKKAEKARAMVVAKMDDLMQQAGAREKEPLISQKPFPSNATIQDLDNLIFSYLDLRSEEIAAINENVSLIRNAAQPAKGGKIPKLWKASSKEQWDAYDQALSKALTTHMAKDIRAVASVCAYSSDVAVVRVTRQHKDDNSLFPVLQRKKAVHLTDMPNDILQHFERNLGCNIYLQRYALVFTEYDLYLIKPRQCRFWLTGAAYADADRIMGHLSHAGGTI
ncbi:MAG: N-6 DNA methylase [Desulforhopalus sp.]